MTYGERFQCAYLWVIFLAVNIFEQKKNRGKFRASRRMCVVLGTYPDCAGFNFGSGIVNGQRRSCLLSGQGTIHVKWP